MYEQYVGNIRVLTGILFRTVKLKPFLFGTQLDTVDHRDSFEIVAMLSVCTLAIFQAYC